MSWKCFAVACLHYSKSDLHVSGDIFAHHQERLTVFTVSGNVHPSCSRLVSWMSWKCFAVACLHYSKSALHVSGDVFAHHQERLTVFTVSASVHPSCCRLVSWMSWKCFAVACLHSSKSDLHVSGDVFAHHQERLTVFAVSGNVHPSCCWLVSWMSWKCFAVACLHYSKSALHVSGDVFAHHQERLTVFTVSGSVHPSCCRLVSWMSWNCKAVSTQQLGWTLPDTVNTVKCSWWWSKTSPKTCRADLE